MNAAAITYNIYILIKPAAVGGLAWVTTNELLAVGLLIDVSADRCCNLPLSAPLARVAQCCCTESLHCSNFMYPPSRKIRHEPPLMSACGIIK